MPSFTRPQLVSYAVVAVAVLVLGGRWLAARGGEEPAAAAAPALEQARPVAVEERAPPRVLVHVAGAVRRPGVYRLPGDARVRDAVERAGGARGGGDPNAINLAAVLQDGAQVLVPRRAPSTASAAAAIGAVAGSDDAAAPPAAPVNLNTASAEELQTLDGVGPATAAAILEYRTQQGGFRSVDDLDQVPGIGPKTMEALRDSVIV